MLPSPAATCLSHHARARPPPADHPFDHPFDAGPAEKLAYYATPPLSPTAHRISFFDTSEERHAVLARGMDGDDGARRQYDPSGYAAARGYGHTSRSASGSSASDRFRQTPTSAPRSGMASQGAAAVGYAYSQGPQAFAPQLHDSPLQQYQPDFQPDQQRSPYAPYGAGLGYHLPSQQPPPPAFDPVPPYQPRPSAAADVLASQFGVAQYYGTAEPASAAGPVPHPYAAPSFHPSPTSYHPPAPAGRGSIPSPYSAGMADYAPPDPHDAAPEPEGFDAAYGTYLASLRRTFEETRDGRLVEAGQRLLEISEWLLGHAHDFGLTRDDQELLPQRTTLWNDFNTCWLAVLQRQKDITQEMIDSSQPPPPPQSILQEDFLEKMGREIVRLCDGMERHGLVDYQVGVWEEEIISTLIDCLDLLEGDVDDVPTAPPIITPHSASSAHNPRQRAMA